MFFFKISHTKNNYFATISNNKHVKKQARWIFFIRPLII